VTVLVDELAAYPEEMVARKARKHGRKWCHLVSDKSLEELHEFAGRIGLKRAWFQRDHYDLTPGMRVRAVRAGAVEVTARELVERRVGRRIR
jgi:hypothetical protein